MHIYIHTNTRTHTYVYMCVCVPIPIFSNLIGNRSIILSQNKKDQTLGLHWLRCSPTRIITNGHYPNHKLSQLPHTLVKFSFQQLLWNIAHTFNLYYLLFPSIGIMGNILNQNLNII